MKNIILAISPEEPEQNNFFAFAVLLAKLTNSRITGVFLENLAPTLTPGVKFVLGNAFVETISSAETLKTKARIIACNDCIPRFEDRCHKENISYTIHRDSNLPLEELIAESRYADLMIIDARAFTSKESDIPSSFVKEAMLKAECPVIIAPHHPLEKIENIFFAFDNDISGMFAIKQFAYLFPEFKNIPLTILHAYDKEPLPDSIKEKIFEFLNMKFDVINLQDMQGKPEDVLFNFFLRKQNAITIMGAYSRSKLSLFLKHSTVDFPIKISNLPIFITHHQV